MENETVPVGTAPLVEATVAVKVTGCVNVIALKERPSVIDGVLFAAGLTSCKTVFETSAV